MHNQSYENKIQYLSEAACELYILTNELSERISKIEKELEENNNE